MGQKGNQEVVPMSIFPTRILLATDSSENVAHAMEVTVQLSKETGSELHLVYVGEDAYSATLVYPEATDPGGVEREDPILPRTYRAATAAVRADVSPGARDRSGEGA
jgi:nucleotide-binding universal stress UspA family protein